MSVQLDTDKVIALARRNNIHTPSALNLAILEVRGLTKSGGQATKVGDRVWKSESIDEKSAMELAEALGVASYKDLQFRMPSLWSEFRSSARFRKKMISFELEDEVSEHNLFKYRQSQYQSERQVPISASWRLNLTSIPGHYVMAILRNSQDHWVITPGIHGFAEQWETDAITIPENDYLNFDEEKGDGWREVLVISSVHNVFDKPTKHDDLILDQTARENLASRLLAQKEEGDVLFDSIDFMLQNEPKK